MDRAVDIRRIKGRRPDPRLSVPANAPSTSETTLGKRSNLLVIVGITVFLLGGAVVLLVLRNSDPGNGNAAAASTANGDQTIVVATKSIDPGASGSDLISSGAVRVKTVQPGGRAGDAIGSTGELVGKVVTVAVKDGDQLRTSMLRSETLRSNSIHIPDGKQAVAVQLDFVPGGAGYVGPGDAINVYANVSKSADPKTPVPFTKLLLSGVQVLDVSTEVAPRVAANQPDAPARAGSQAVTFLLALDANQAERMIFATTNDQLYATLVPKGQGPVGTGGHTEANLFQG